MSARVFELADPAATEQAGAAIAGWMASRAGGVLFLSGDLGAGKTSLARGLLRAWGVQGAVRSPSYTLVEPYECDGYSVLHMDLYRLRDPDEFEGLGLRDFNPERWWWIVEWPEHGRGHLPAPSFGVSLAVNGSGRRLALERCTLTDDEYRALCSALDEAFGSQQKI